MKKFKFPLVIAQQNRERFGTRMSQIWIGVAGICSIGKGGMEGRGMGDEWDEEWWGYEVRKGKGKGVVL